MRTVSSFQIGLVLASLLLVEPGPVRAQPAPPPIARLSAQIDSTLQRPALDGAHWGVAVMNLRTGEWLYQRTPKHHFVPASNVKLFTSAAALDQLGPAFRYQTTLFAEGAVRDSTLYGRLILRGAGDPTLGGYGQRDDPTAPFRAWADSLRNHGIRAIRGDIVGDDNAFADTPLGYGWSWDDTPYAYAAELGGLAFNQNKIEIALRGERIGKPAALSWTPHQTTYVDLINRSMTIPRSGEIDEEYERDLGTNAIVLKSTVPLGATETEDLAIHNPTRFTVHVLREVLRQQGIAIDGAARDIDHITTPPLYDSQAVRPVARYTSPPLDTIVRQLNFESLNLYAEQVLRTLGVERPVEDAEDDLQPGTAEMGIAASMRTFAAAGIDTSRIQLADGSGLSRHNLVSPQAIVNLLKYMQNHPNPAIRTAFLRSLPAAGRDGTLQYRRIQGGRGAVRAKTGTLSNISSLSGYLTTAGGTPVAFAILCNQYLAKTRQVRQAQDQIVNILASSAY